MAGIDYINALGAGASFDTKKIVESLVEAERAGAHAQIERKLADAESKISGLGAAASILDILKEGAELLNDAKDFNALSIHNSQSSAIEATVTNNARTGTNSVTVSSIAREQRSISDGFDSSTATINGANTTTISITIDANTENIPVGSASLDSIKTAINEADLGVRAEIVNTGTGSGNYRLQLVGESGSDNAFSVSSDFSGLNIQSIQSASNANLNVNGVDFTRSTNQISDIIEGVSLNVASVTNGTATISVNRDVSEAKGNIIAFVAMINEANLEFKKLTSSELDGPLRGDSIFGSMTRSLRSIVVGTSSSPGSSINSLSNMGISIDRNGQLNYDEAKLDQVLSNDYDDVIKVFTANTDNQSRFSTEAGGIAGDIKNLIERVTASDGYLVTADAALQARKVEYDKDADELAARMEKVEERYNRQFLVMQSIIEEMNSTKESMISSFENLPFSNRD
jgi:flagellar hook-associated protein 2|tara:strand:+ start:9329 stop:10699 length:1371 start_codon:yes stop_codon:yes gene_type:complete